MNSVNVENAVMAERRRISEAIDKVFQDEHPLDPITDEPVETYGYEVTFNSALIIAKAIVNNVINNNHE